MRWKQNNLPLFLTTTSAVHLLPAPPPPLLQRSCDNTNYSSHSANQHYSFNCWFCCSVHLHKPIQHTWALSSQGQPAWLDWGRCEGTSWCFRKRAWRNYWPSSTLTPRSNIPTLGCDLWNYCSASEICFRGALSASQCAVKTGEKRDTRRRSLTVDVHAPPKRTTRTNMSLYSWVRQSTDRPFFMFKLPVRSSFTVDSR